MSQILLVEDESAIAESIIYNLQKKNYLVTHASGGKSADDFMMTQKYDLVILDVRLPEISGFELCQKWRQQKIRVPILFLTARDTNDDVIYGLKSGGDDYLTKPFDLSILLARIESLLRRGEWNPSRHNDTTPKRHEFGKFWVDLETWQAKTLMGNISLSRKEIGVMKLLLESNGRVITRREILDKVWNLPAHPNERVVDNVIVNLRRYFEENSATPVLIINVRGSGYQFIKP